MQSNVDYLLVDALPADYLLAGALSVGDLTADN